MEYGLQIRGQTLKLALPPVTIMGEICVGVSSALNRKHWGAGRAWQGIDAINKHALRTCCDGPILPFGEDV